MWSAGEKQERWEGGETLILYNQTDSNRQDAAWQSLSLLTAITQSPDKSLGRTENLKAEMEIKSFQLHKNVNILDGECLTLYNPPTIYRFRHCLC